MKHVLFVCDHRAGAHRWLRRSSNAGRGRARRISRHQPARDVWPEVIAVMHEVDIDISDRKPRRVLRAMQLDADCHALTV